jgi:hypothetical protein
VPVTIVTLDSDIVQLAVEPGVDVFMYGRTSRRRRR